MKTNKASINPLILKEDISTIQYAQVCKSIKGNFIHSGNDQAKLYIRDLEKTVAINKEIIIELMKDNLPEEKNKSIIIRLNNENAILQAQIKRLTLERDEAYAKLLITEQIVENFRKREGECCKELAEKHKDMIDQLDRKEFNLQKLERKYERALTALKNLEHKDQGVSKILKVLKADKRTDCKVTNVIEENDRLQTELINAKERVRELTIQVNSGAGIIQQHLNDIKDERGDELEIKALKSLKLKKKKHSGENLMTIKILKEEIERLNLQIEELYKLNMNLSEALRSANDKLKAINRKENTKSRSRNRSELTHCSESKTSYKSTTKKKIIDAFEVDKDLDTELNGLPSPIPKVNKKLLN